MRKHDAVRLNRRFHDVPETKGQVKAVIDDNLLVDFGEGFLRLLPSEVLQQVPEVVVSRPKLAVVA